jgi:WD40 repeat protein
MTRATLLLVALVALAAAQEPAPKDPVDAFGDPLPPGAIARLGTLRFRTADFPKQLAVSPDGNQIVSTQSLQHVRLTVWEADTGRQVREVELPNYPQPEAICWAADAPGLAAVKVGPKDYVVWSFTEPMATVPSGDRSNSSGLGTFAASAFSPDGTLIAGGERAGEQGTAGKLQVWPVRPGRPVREAAPRYTVDTTDGFVALMFTTDGKRLVGVTQGRQPDRVVPPGRIEPGAPIDTARVFVWNAATGKELMGFDVAADGFPLDGMSRSPRHAVSPDGKTLFVPAKEGHVKAFDLATGKERFDAVAFGPHGDTTKALLPGWKVQIGSLALTPDGRTLVAAESMGRTVGLDAATGKERWRGGREMDPIYALAVFPDSRRFALGHGNRQIGVYDAATGKSLVEPIGPRGGLTAVGITPDGRAAITAGWDKSLFHWDLASGRLMSRVEVQSSTRSRVGGFSPDAKRVIDRPGVFDTTTGKLAVPFDTSGLMPVWPTGRVAWLPDSSVVVCNEESTAARYSADGKKRADFVVAPAGKRGTGPQIEGVAVSPDGKTVVLAGEGAPDQGFLSSIGWVTVFDAATGTKVRDLKSKATGGFTSAAFLPDGSRVVLGRHVFQPPRRVGQPETVLDLATAVALYDPKTGDLITPFNAPDATAQDRWVRAVAVSATGTQVAAVEWDNSLTVYETATGAVRRRLAGHRGMVEQVTFTPEGGRLVSVSDDGTGLVWDVGPPRPAAAITVVEADRTKRWAALLAPDTDAAWRATGELAADPAGTVAFLKTHLKPTPAPTDADIDRLLAGLAAPAFAAREAAARDLDALGGLAVGKVRDRLPGVTSAEVRQRLDEFLKRHDRPGRTTGYRLREVRSVELLEAIGMADARALLTELGRGDGPLAVAATAAGRRFRSR